MPQCQHDVRISLREEVAAPAASNAAITSSPTVPIDGIKAGSAVEYFSQSRGRWIPARVLRVDPGTGLLDLDCKDQVELESVRPVVPEEAEFQTQDSGCGQQ